MLIMSIPDKLLLFTASVCSGEECGERGQKAGKIGNIRRRIFYRDSDMLKYCSCYVFFRAILGLRASWPEK
jgi:hypothetical protein